MHAALSTSGKDPLFELEYRAEAVRPTLAELAARCSAEVDSDSEEIRSEIARLERQFSDTFAVEDPEALHRQIVDRRHLLVAIDGAEVATDTLYRRVTEPKMLGGLKQHPQYGFVPELAMFNLLNSCYVRRTTRGRFGKVVDVTAGTALLENALHFNRLPFASKLVAKIALPILVMAIAGALLAALGGWFAPGAGWFFTSPAQNAACGAIAGAILTAALCLTAAACNNQEVTEELRAYFVGILPDHIRSLLPELSSRFDEVVVASYAVGWAANVNSNDSPPVEALGPKDYRAVRVDVAVFVRKGTYWWVAAAS